MKHVSARSRYARTLTTRLLTAGLLLGAYGCDSDDTPATEDAASDAATMDASDTSADAALDVAEDAAPDAAPVTCWDDLAVGETEVFYAGLEDNSEGIAFGADGRMYVGSGDTIFAIDSDGVATAFATVPEAIGIAAVADGLIVASFGPISPGPEVDGAVYHVSWEGESTIMAEGIANPNFITAMPNGDFLVSDDFDTRVFRVTRDGEVTEAILDIDSPNGMAYVPDGSAVVVVSTFSDLGEVTRIPVDADGVPAAEGWTELAQLGRGATADGVAIGANGDIYVAANLRNQIVRVPAEGGEHEVIADGVRTAASLAFGVGEGFDPCSVYVTQLIEENIIRVSLGQGAAPLFDGTTQSE